MSDTRLDEQLSGELEHLRAHSRLRHCPPIEQGTRTHLNLSDSGPLTSFCSNDYLALSTHPAIIAAAGSCLGRTGVGAGASRLVSGDQPDHRALEDALAEHFGYPAALLFPTGYQANLGVLTALCGPEDLIVSDALNHASLIDGCRLSRAKVVVYPHADPAAAETALADTKPNFDGRFRRRILVTESVFSMDGDIAPLAALTAICARHNAELMVDEAHSVGVLGPQGTGLCADLGLKPTILVGTLGKAFGTAGGFVVGSRNLRSYLVNKARTFIFTTALPPSIAAATLASLRLVQGAEGEELRQKLHHHIRSLHAGLGLARALTPVTPWIVGADARAVELSQRLRRQGLFVPAIRPPTVPEGTARLRITLSAGHRDSDISQLINKLLTSNNPE